MVARCLLNIDLGELPDEDEALYRLAHVASLACGGHAGDDASMRLALERCARHGTRAGAHPSFEDRAGFGRREQDVPPEVLRAQVEAQCARLARLAAERGVPLAYVKPHGALYHAAHRSPAVAGALVDAARAALGPGVIVIGPAAGALADAARAAGLPYAREGFADRGTRADGTLIPRGQPGAVLTDPARAREHTLGLAAGHEVETVCVHGDTPGAVGVATEVRAALDALALELAPLGEAALRVALPAGVDARAGFDALRALPGVVDAVVTEEHAALYFGASAEDGAPAWTPAHAAALGGPPSSADDPRLVLARLALTPHGDVLRPLHTVRVRYDGPDLEALAAHAGLPVEVVIGLHHGREYTVRVVGFLPGFAYLGEVDARLSAPRRTSPRPRVPALAVGIAGARTGVYPAASPGGWNLVGTAVDFVPFHPERGAALALGDRVRFERVG